MYSRTHWDYEIHIFIVLSGMQTFPVTPEKDFITSKFKADNMVGSSALFFFVILKPTRNFVVTVFVEYFVSSLLLIHMIFESE